MKKFNIPVIKIDLKFFLTKNNDSLDDLERQIFKEHKDVLTSDEKVYALSKALEPFKIMLPIESNCPFCEANNKRIVELSKYIKTSGESYKNFTLTIDDYIFEFERPLNNNIELNTTSKIGAMILLIAQWLKSTNQSEDFELTSLDLPIFLKLVEEFSKHLLITEINFKTKCSNCEKDMSVISDITITDLLNFIKDL